jgi:hypothetical protein
MLAEVLLVSLTLINWFIGGLIGQKVKQDETIQSTGSLK